MILLPLFGIVGLLVLAMEVYTDHPLYHEGVEAAEPHGPGEFPEIFAFDPLEGLDEDGEEIHLPPPPLSEDYWPCSECHEPDDYDPERRTLTMEHSGITLRHDEENRWCLDCHDAEDRDKLRLASGKRISFQESHRLCGQCHGTIYRDWRAGIHGKRTGYWDGPRRYLLCVHCHRPHSPQIKPLKPMPPPVRPEYLRHRRGGAGAEAPSTEGAEGEKHDGSEEGE